MSRLFCICFFGTKIYPIFARMSKNENIMNKVLIIDDEPQIRQLLARILGLEGYEVLQAGDCKAAVKQMEYSPNVVLCDVFLPDGNGVDFIKTIKKISPESEIILLTAHGNIPDGVQAIKNGAFDYITKGDDNNKIIPLISRAMEKARTNGVKNRPERNLSAIFIQFYSRSVKAFAGSYRVGTKSGIDRCTGSFNRRDRYRKGSFRPSDSPREQTK